MAVNKDFSENIKDKVFLVTGGAAGIGARVVRALLTENARSVAFLDIAEREGAALETELLHKFGALRAKFIKCDISDEQQLAAAYHQVLDKYRCLDAVINNAAVLYEDANYRKMIDINFTALVSSTHKSIDIMAVDKGGSGGSIVNISSLLALKQTSHSPVYSATKTAVLQFSNAIGAAEHYSKTKIRVMTVCLGPTDTALIQKRNLENFRQDSSQSLTSRIPVRQSVDSAAAGIIEVIKRGDSGSTWIVADDKPAKDVTETIKDGFEVLSQYCPEV